MLFRSRSFAERQAKLAVAWVRVGYVQGNMNSDNCLLSGRTMDYGPFGFVEAYEPLWSPFTSDMERKFGFERQPLAAQVNLMTLARAALSMFVALDGDQRAAAELQAIVNEEYPALLSAQLGEWLAEYAARLKADGRPAEERAAEMRATSPKYVPREWMLAEAYTAAEQGDHAPLEELRALFAAPFDEHPEYEERYYRRTPPAQRQKGGISFMS